MQQKLLLILFLSCIIPFAQSFERIFCIQYPGVAQLVARLIWDQEAAGSSPVTRILEKPLSHKRFKSFLFHYSAGSYSQIVSSLLSAT